MKRTAYRVWIGVLALWIIGALASPAHAVIPSALGPMQALIAILPHLLVLLGAAFVAILKPSTYRAFFKYCWTHKILTLTAFVPVGVLVWGGSQLFSAPVAKENLATIEWSAFRGGAERTGSVPNSSGPLQNGKVHKGWPYLPTIGNARDIDSSPTIVGNRVYFGLNAGSVQRTFGGICCVDTDSGSLVWQITDAGGELNPPLQSVFSSPAVAGEFSDAVKPVEGKKPVGRYLISGEGYHYDKNSRMICLDLEPVRLGQRKDPKLHWAIPTTSHVEASPCVFEGKAYFGAGDDGVFCVDIASGKIKWHLDGCDTYYISAGPQVDALSKLAGKTVAVSGTPLRHWIDEDKSLSAMLISADEFKEVDATAGPQWNAKFERTVVGKITVAEAPPAGIDKASRVKIEIPEYFADAESPPVAVRINNEARLVFGSGIDGQSVSCVDAETGKLIWRTKTEHPAFSSPTVVNGKVILGLSNGTYVKSDPKPAGAVLCLNAADGKELWQVKTADGVCGAVAVKDNTAYACARDGNLYVVDVNAGRLLTTYATGSTMVCSPAVTDKAVFMSTSAGKVFCVGRPDHKFKWSLSLTPGTPIISSPAVSGGKLFIGTQKKGLFCIASDTGEVKSIAKAAPWCGSGGNAMRSNVAVETSAPILGDKAERLWDDKKFPKLQLSAPLAACGDFIYGASNINGNTGITCVKISNASIPWRQELPGPARAICVNENYLSAVTEQSGKFEVSILNAGSGSLWKTLPAASDVLACGQNHLVYSSTAETIACVRFDGKSKEWRGNVGELVGSPILAHNLIIAASKTPPRLMCLDDLTGVTLWSTPLPTAPITPPTLSGDKILIALSTPDILAAYKLFDGEQLWKVELNKPPVSHLAASADHVAFLASNNRVYVHKTINGEQTHTVIIGKGAQAPAIINNTLLIGADERLGGYDLTSSNWSWGLKDQKLIGKVFAPPLLAKEIVWVSTEKLGLINVGQKE